MQARGQQPALREWAVLSVSSLLQRTPRSTAIAGLACLFVNVSQHPLIRSLAHHIISKTVVSVSTHNHTYIDAHTIYFYIFCCSHASNSPSGYSVVIRLITACFGCQWHIFSWAKYVWFLDVMWDGLCFFFSYMTWWYSHLRTWVKMNSTCCSRCSTKWQRLPLKNSFPSFRLMTLHDWK